MLVDGPFDSTVRKSKDSSGNIKEFFVLSGMKVNREENRFGGMNALYNTKVIHVHRTFLKNQNEYHLTLK